MKKLMYAAALSALLISPAQGADVVTEDIVEEAQASIYVTVAAGVKFGEDWDDSISISGEEKIATLEELLGLCLKDVVDASADADLESDSGYRASVAVGWQMNQYVALEAEVSGMWQDFSEFAVGDISLVPAEGEPQVLPCQGEDCSGTLDGDISIITLMANVVLGLPIADGFIIPYVGAGAGAALVSLDDLRALETDILDDSDTVFAGQVFAGFMVVVAQGIGIGVRGRLLFISDVQLEDQFGFQHDLSPDPMASVEATATLAF